MDIATSTDLVRYDLGCGSRCKEGFTGVDKFAKGDKIQNVDLFKFPWPWADNSVDELHASHFLEHIPAREVEDRDCQHPDKGMPSHLYGTDMLCAFMDEAWRVLKPGGVFAIVVPNARNNRAFQDPTHRRFFVAETFLYFAKDWRIAGGLDHYLCKCDFGVEVNHTMLSEMGTLHPEAQARRFNESWNVILDWHARLVAKK